MSRILRPSMRGPPGVSADRKGGEKDAEIQWGGETGLCSDAVRSHGYALKGKTPAVLAKPTARRWACFSTVNNKRAMRWKVFSGAWARRS